MSEAFWNTFVLVLLLIDPLGNIPSFNAVLSHIAPGRRRFIITRECAIGYGVLLLFTLAGQPILRFFHISESSLGIGGGLVLFLIAIKMIFGSAENVFGDETEKGQEPLIVPLAVPLLAGPSAIASVMLQSARHPDHQWVIIAAISSAFILATLCLLLGAKMAAYLGTKGISALTRLVGLVLVAVSVEMMLSGFRSFWGSLPVR